MRIQVVEAKCVEVNCPYWGFIKIKFSDLDFNYWEDCRDRGIEIKFKCPCGEEHEIMHW